MQTQTLSRLMRLSWQIQKRRNYNRSKSLCQAWAIFLNEDLTVHYLVLKHSNNNRPNKPAPAGLALFNN